MRKIYILMIMILLGGVVNAQWQQCNGPYGGFITSFASDSNNIFTGTNNGIYKTSNNGQNWIEVSSGLSQKSISALAFCGTKIYAGTPDSGLFVSSNYGSLWTAVGGISDKHIISIVVKDSNIYLATLNSGIIYSHNTGSSWNIMNSNGLTLSISDIAVNDTAIFVATQSGLYQTYNNGLNWQQASLPMLGLQIHNIATKGSKVVISSGNGIFISVNNGNSWTAANNNPFLYCGNFPIIISDTSIYLGTYSCGVYKSSDNGLTWNQMINGLYTMNVRKLTTIGNTILAGTYGGGIFKFDNNGMNWNQINTGIVNTNIRSLLGNNTEVYAADLYGNGIYKSLDNGLTWIPSNNGISERRNFFEMIAKGSNIFALNNNGIFRSTDNGLNWSKSNNGIDTNSYATCITFYGNKIIAGDESKVGFYISTDNGSNWILNPINLGNLYNKIKSFAINGDTIYALTGRFIIKSINGGLTWIAIYEANTDVFNMGRIYLSGNNILVSENPSITLPGGIYVGWLALSNDNGNSWTNINITPDNPFVYSMASNSSFAFAATNRGIYLSTNNGYSWIDISNNLNNSNCLKVMINGNYLYVSLQYGGIWRRPLTDFVGIDEKKQINHISLYPNPATNSLTINLNQLKNLQNSTVSIYDIQGKLLLQQNISQLQTVLDINSFAKGIYIVKINTDKETLQSKFVKQ